MWIKKQEKILVPQNTIINMCSHNESSLVGCDGPDTGVFLNTQLYFDNICGLSHQRLEFIDHVPP